VNRALFILLLTSGYENSIFSQIDVVYSKLVWTDEFTTNGAIDTAKWFHQTQLPDGNNWYNGEVQHYTDRTVNSIVSNGLLNIVAKKETFTHQLKTKNYTSARLNSKFAFTYGRVDIKAKIPMGAGTWPAIWLLGKNIIEPGAFFTSQFGTTHWPACGEIDIMEHGIFHSQLANFINSAIHTTSSSGSTINQGGKLATNLGTDYHVYTMNWSPNQLTFLLDNVVYYTYKPTVKNASTWPFDKDQYILLNIAMGGVAGAIPSSFTQESMLIDYVRVYQLGDTVQKDTTKKDTIVKDTLIPTNLSAKLGAISSRSIELLLNTQDNSDTIFYQIKYGSNQLNVWSLSGIEKSILIDNLNPETEYIFEIIASDKSGNKTITKILNAKTTAWIGCKGSGSSVQQGSFSQGYNYSFESSGTDLMIEFELLDTDKPNPVAFLLTKNPLNELTTTPISGNKFILKLIGQTAGATQEYALKFSYGGGTSISNYLSYTFGGICSSSSSISESSEPNFYFQNPVEDYLTIQSSKKIDELVIYNFLGQKVLSTNEVSNSIDLKHIPSGAYQLMIRSKGQFKFYKLIKNN
jgi:beta-glucanase (GH16 family)